MRNIKRYEKWWLKLVGWTIPLGDPCEEPHEHVIMEGIEIDVLIAPLVRLLWDRDIQTHNSCQGEPTLQDSWRRHGMNHSQGGESHAAYLTLDSYWDVTRLVHVIGTYPGISAHGEVAFKGGTVQPNGQRLYFLHFPGHVLEQPAFVDHVSRML